VGPSVFLWDLHGSGFGRPVLLFSVADKMPTRKSSFFKVFFAYYFLKVRYCTFTSVFIDKKSKRSHKIVEIKVFLTFFAC
jgi:hypothetical protein